MGNFNFDDNVHALSVEGDKSTGEISFPKEGCSIMLRDSLPSRVSDRHLSGERARV
jgi:hypothetical protein